jgi:hypothetical protein
MSILGIYVKFKPEGLGTRTEPELDPKQRGRVLFCLAALYRHMVAFADGTVRMVVLPI